MAVRPVFRSSPSRAERFACRLILLLCLALQLEAIQEQRQAAAPSMVAVSSGIDTSLDGPDSNHPHAAAAESGWIVVAGAERSTSWPRTPADSFRRLTAQRTDVAVARWFETLDVRASLDGVKYGRDASRSTTVPPPIA